MSSPAEAVTRVERTRARRARILELVDERDFVSVRELSEEFGLSDMSVRRELTAMEADGQIARLRGGATRPRTVASSRQYAAGAQRNAATKIRIAKAAVALIPEDSVVFFYSGSTVARTAASVPDSLRESLTIVTNSLPIITEVSAWEDPHLVTIGGTYLAAYMANVGPQAIASLEPLSADLAVVGCDGLTAERGLTTPHQLVATIGTTMVKRAQRTIVVADSTKVGRTGFTPICAIEDIHVLVTDTGADERELELLRDRGIEVLVV
ncbi:MAG: DeoR/GlpR family DNA-binding transcription regulator [Actinomycetes bacterium]